ncbi:MAG: hypothetical protein ACRCSN_13760 [Dermatophilaceae bacterium]
MTFGEPGDPKLLAILCGVVAFDSPAVHDLLAVLPRSCGSTRRGTR